MDLINSSGGAEQTVYLCCEHIDLKVFEVSLDDCTLNEIRSVVVSFRRYAFKIGQHTHGR